MPLIAIGTAIAVVTTIFGIYVSHVLSRARELVQQMGQDLRDYRTRRKKLATHIASRLANMKREEEIMQYMTEVVFKYHDLITLASEVKEALDEDLVIGTARRYFFAGAALLLYLTVAALVLRDLGTVLVLVLLVAAMLMWMGYNAEKEIGDYGQLASQLNGYLDELGEEVEG